MRRVSVAVLLVVLAVGCGGCERDSGQQEATEDTAPDERRPRVVSSDDLPAKPRRIVSLAPNVTEILFALGVGGRVVGVTKFCDYPEQASERPSVGSFSNPDFESILARKPDLVVGGVSGGSEAIYRRLKEIGVPYLFVRMDTVEETYAGIGEIGTRLGVAGRAESLTARMRRRMERLERQWRGEEPPRVLLVYGHEPIVAAGPGSFGHELLRRAGGRNVLESGETRFPRLDVEKVVELDPDYIVDTTMVPAQKDPEFWSAHRGIEAVERGRVAYLEDPAVLRAGPRLPAALEMIGEAIHSDRRAPRESDAAGGRD